MIKIIKHRSLLSNNIAINYFTIVFLFFIRASSTAELVFLLTSLNSLRPVVNISSNCKLVIFGLNLLSSKSCFT